MGSTTYDHWSPRLPVCVDGRLQTVIVTHVPEGPRNLAKVELEELYVRICDMHTSLQEARAVNDARAKTISQKKTEILDLKSTSVQCRSNASDDVPSSSHRVSYLQHPDVAQPVE